MLPMTPEETYYTKQLVWHLRSARHLLRILADAQHQKPHGGGEIYRRLSERFDRTLELALGEFEYGLLAYLSGRLPGLTEENDAANALGRSPLLKLDSPQQENASSQSEKLGAPEDFEDVRGFEPGDDYP